MRKLMVLFIIVINALWCYANDYAHEYQNLGKPICPSYELYVQLRDQGASFEAIQLTLKRYPPEYYKNSEVVFVDYLNVINEEIGTQKHREITSQNTVTQENAANTAIQENSVSQENSAKYATEYEELGKPQCPDFNTFVTLRENGYSMDTIKATLTQYDPAKYPGRHENTIFAGYVENVYKQEKFNEEMKAARIAHEEQEKKRQKESEAERARAKAAYDAQKKADDELAAKQTAESAAREKAKEDAMQQLTVEYKMPFCNYRLLSDYAVKKGNLGSSCLLVLETNGLLKVLQQIPDGTLGMWALLYSDEVFLIEKNRQDSGLVDGNVISAGVFEVRGTYQYMTALGTKKTIQRLRRLR